MFLPLLALTLLLALDLAKGNLSESTLALLTSLVTVLGGSFITLFGAFLLLMNKEVRKRYLNCQNNFFNRNGIRQEEHVARVFGDVRGPAAASSLQTFVHAQ